MNPSGAKSAPLANTPIVVIMRILILMARRLTGSALGNQYMLSLAEDSNSNFGLSLDPVSDHAYKTLNDLCAFIERCDVLDSNSLGRFRTALEARGESAIEITEQIASRLGFHLS